jgi:para-nitrobenzyl esterase
MFLALLGAGCGHSDASTVVINISGVGAVRGNVIGAAPMPPASSVFLPPPPPVGEFLSIPFGQPPVGELRFMPPVPAKPWDNVLNATATQNICPQFVPLTSGPPRNESEDCLTLNVWSPLRPSGAKPLPVYVFLHGGGDMAGYGAAESGYYLAQKGGGLVVVTLNYRLGPLGMLSAAIVRDAAIAKGLPPTYGGMNALLDQQLALEWVAQHVSAFGGDPARITLGGESAGAVAVCMHAHAPRSAPMLDAVVLESGECTGPWGPWNESIGLMGGALWMRSVNVSTIEQLQALPLHVMLASPVSLQANAAVDGYFLPRHPKELPVLLHGKSAIVGSNGMDTLCSPPFGNASSPVPWPTDAVSLTATFEHWFTTDAERVAPYYPPQPLPAGTAVAGASPSALAFLIATRDTGTTCPAAWFSEKLVRAANTVYLYEFDYAFNSSWPVRRPTRLDSTRLDSTRLDSARLGSTRLHLT